MKKSTLHAMCLLSGLVLGGLYCGTTATASTLPNVNAADDDNTLTAGDDTNKATFKWSGNKLTVTGKGDLSKVTVTDQNTKVFSAAGAGQVYTKIGDNTTAVKEGDKYDASTCYYETEVAYGEAMVPSISWNANYSMTSTWTLKLLENQTIHAMYVENGDVKITTQSQPENITSSKPWDWDDKADNTNNTYYKYCIVEGTCPTVYQTTIALSSFNKGVYTTSSYKVILLTDDNRDTYAASANIIKASVANLYYSSDATNYTWLPKDTTVEYTDGMKLYNGTVSVKDEPIADNSTYFGITHVDYITGLSASFADYLKTIMPAKSNVSDYYNVVFDSEDDSNLASINNEIVQTLMNCSVRVLNLRGVGIKSINSPYTDANASAINTDGTFLMATEGQPSYNSNSTIETLFTPQITGTTDADKTLKWQTFGKLSKLRYLHISKGVETLDEQSVQGTANAMQLSVLTFPEGLKTIKKYACRSHFSSSNKLYDLDGNEIESIQTLVFPSSMELIEKEAFNGTCPKDVYFLGVNAPKVEKFAWGDDAYISNNAFAVEAEDGQSGTTLTVSVKEGYACRSNYKAQSGWEAMLHYPAACTKAQAARYTDITRDYRRIDLTSTGEGFSSVDDGNGNKTTTYYNAGKETAESGNADYSTLKGSGNSTQRACKIRFRSGVNANAPYDHTQNYNGGFYDMYVKNQYLWPSVDMFYRATVVAQNGVLWDGTTTIGEGIKNAGETSYSGTGEQYIGLHQFIFAQADVTQTKTDEWDMSKYGDGQWHSICLPFDLTKGDMKEIFGPTNDEGTEYNIRLCKFNKVLRVANTDNNRLKLYFNDEKFEKASDNDVILEAHVSYMIKAEKKKAAEDEHLTCVMKDYVMKAGSPIPTNVTVDENDGTSTHDEGVSTQSDNVYFFIGNYMTNMVMPQYTYFYSASRNKFRFQIGTTAKWNAYTSVVEAPNGTQDNTDFFYTQSGAGAKEFATLFEDDGDAADKGTTGIDRVTIIAGDEVVYTNDNVYNLNGQLVSTKGLNGLAKGIYVQNGKKYIVK